MGIVKVKNSRPSLAGQSQLERCDLKKPVSADILRETLELLRHRLEGVDPATEAKAWRRHKRVVAYVGADIDEHRAREQQRLEEFGRADFIGFASPPHAKLNFVPEVAGNGDAGIERNIDLNAGMLEPAMKNLVHYPPAAREIRDRIGERAKPSKEIH
jgi:hypothetical protein